MAYQKKKVKKFKQTAAVEDLLAASIASSHDTSSNDVSLTDSQCLNIVPLSATSNETRTLPSSAAQLDQVS